MVRYILIGLMFLTSAAYAQPADPPAMAKCRHALDELNAHEDSIAASRKSNEQSGPADAGARTKLTALRKVAVHLCLGGPIDFSQPTRQTAQPPMSVSANSITPATRLQVPSEVNLTPTPTPMPTRAPQLVVNSCDANGCWASDGTRLQRAGSNLLGPRGYCTLQGALLQCP